jgi:hypothetical protein
MIQTNTVLYLWGLSSSIYVEIVTRVRVTVTGNEKSCKLINRVNDVVRSIGFFSIMAYGLESSSQLIYNQYGACHLLPNNAFQG